MRKFAVMLLTVIVAQSSSAQGEWGRNAFKAPVGAKIQFSGSWEQGTTFVALYCDLEHEVVLMPTGSTTDQYGLTWPNGTIFCVKGDREEVLAYFGEDETDTSES